MTENQKRYQKKVAASAKLTKWRRAGIKDATLEIYDELLAKQQGRCAICRALPTTRQLALDHDHKTGKARGLLCTGCNIGVGSLERFNRLKVLDDANYYLQSPP
jgi:hypothetical protein